MSVFFTYRKNDFPEIKYKIICANNSEISTMCAKYAYICIRPKYICAKQCVLLKTTKFVLLLILLCETWPRLAYCLATRKNHANRGGLTSPEFMRLKCCRRHVQQRRRKGRRLGYAVRERKSVVSPETGGRADRRQRGVRQDQLHRRLLHGEHDLCGARDGRQGLLSGRQRRTADETHGQQTVRDHRYVDI